jgi:hypothetical protein
MTPFTLAKSVTASALGFGILFASSSAYAASVDLSTWSIIGDGIKSSGSVTLTNQTLPGDLVSDGGTTINVSGQNPVSVFDSPNLETQLGLAQGALDIPFGGSVEEGSAIRSILTAAAGEAFSFNWAFPVKDAQDVGFVKIGNTLLTLSGSSPFSYTFTTGGSYDIAIGVVDINDFTNSSKLEITNAQLNAVPTPVLLPGLIGFGIAALRRRLR